MEVDLCFLEGGGGGDVMLAGGFEGWLVGKGLMVEGWLVGFSGIFFLDMEGEKKRGGGLEREL